MIGDRFDYVVECDSKLLRFDHQLLNLVAEQLGSFCTAGFWQLRDNGPNPWSGFQQACSYEVRYHLVCSVGIDLQLFAERADGRERISAAHLSRDDRLFGSVDNLLVQRYAGTKVDAKRNHTRTITRSTPTSSSLSACEGFGSSLLCFLEMSRSPLRDGWRVLMRGPASVLTEIAWRWTFGVAFWAVLYYSFREYFASVEISRAEYHLLRSFEPFTWLAVTARVMVALMMGLRTVGPIIIPALAVLWTALVTIGRSASIRALSDDEPRTNWFSTAILHLFRVVLTSAAVLAYFGCGILIDSMVGDPSGHFAAVFLLGFLALFVIVVVWSILNWFFSLAVLFSVRDHAGFASSLTQTIAFTQEHASSLFRAGSSFGFLRTLLMIIATIGSLLPIVQLSSSHLRFTIFVVVAVTLGYLAVADALNVWRLGFYVSLTEPEPAPPVKAAPAVTPVLEPSFRIEPESVLPTSDDGAPSGPEPPLEPSIET